MKILVIDDEEHILELLKFNLELSGFDVCVSTEANQTIELIGREKPDLLLLDWMLPKISGIDILKKIRQDEDIYDLPVIMLTAKNMEDDKIQGLNVGADDYVTKPFNPVELLARVKSQLRRYLELGSAPVRKSVFRIGDIELDDTAKEVRLMGEKVGLTPKEYGILKFFLEHPGQVFSPAEIYHAVWEETAYGAEGTVAVHIRHLREKLEINPEQPRHLKVVWGQGYKIE